MYDSKWTGFWGNCPVVEFELLCYSVIEITEPQHRTVPMEVSVYYHMNK